MLKTVFDSTVLVSAFLTPTQLSAQLLSQAKNGTFALYLSNPILTETHQTLLDSKKIRQRYEYSNKSVAAFVQGLRSVVNLVTDLPDITGVVRDPNDDMVLACAVAAPAQYLVTRDKDLLTLDTYQHVKILIPEAFIHLLREQSTKT